MLWNNKQVVPLMVPQQREPWVSVLTKKLDGVHMVLQGPKGAFPQGSLTGVGLEATHDGSRPGVDLIRLKLRTTDDVHRPELAAFLKEHLATLDK